MSFITISGTLTDPGTLNSTDGYLHRWTTIMVRIEGATSPLPFAVLVSGDAAAAVDIITRDGRAPEVVFAGRYSPVSVADLSNVGHQVDASYLGLSLTDPSFGVGMNSAPEPWA
jgi:hypothetical protein